MSDSNHPAKTIQVGLVKATIWRNNGEKGVYFTTVLTRSYKNSKNEWKSTDSFRPEDLPVVEKVVSLAFDAVVALEQETKQS